MSCGGPRSQNFKNREREGGFLAVDFLFAVVLTAGVVMMMMALSTTLMVIEISQYIAFSTARQHAAGHNTVAQQRQNAENKFKSYTNTQLFPTLSVFLKNGWFDVSDKTLDIRSGLGAGAGKPDFDEDYGRAENALPQIGVRFTLEAKLLDMNIPFLGPTSRDGGYKTQVTGMIFREPTSEECRRQISQRFNLIKNLGSGRFNGALSMVGSGSADRSYMPLEDNGC